MATTAATALRYCVASLAACAEFWARQLGAHDTVVFQHLRSTAGRVPLNVIAIRGTHVLDLLDWLSDVDIWLESVLFDVAGFGSVD